MSARASLTYAALAALLQCGCFTATEAEDPLPGPKQTGWVVADEETRERYAESSALLPLDAAESASWITSEERLERWFAEDVVLGPVGGEFALRWPSQGTEWTGTLLSFDPAGRLVAEVRRNDGAGMVRLEFTSVPEAWVHRVRVRVGPFGNSMPDEVAAVGYREGLREAFATLRLAANGEPTRAPKVPMIHRVFHPLETPREGLEAENIMSRERREGGPAKPPEPSPKQPSPPPAHGDGSESPVG